MAMAEHRFSVDSSVSSQELLTRLDEAVRARKGRVDVEGPLVRIYSLGSSGLYRLWGAWWPRRLFPFVAHVAVGQLTAGSTADVHVESTEGWYLFYVPAFWKHAHRAFSSFENALRQIAAG